MTAAKSPGLVIKKPPKGEFVIKTKQTDIRPVLKRSGGCTSGGGGGGGRQTQKIKKDVKHKAELTTKDKPPYPRPELQRAG